MAVYNLPTGYEDKISINASYSTEARLRQVEFGDGYIQRTPLGINSLIRNLDLSFENLTQTERNTLVPFFQAIQYGGHAVEIEPNELLVYSGKYVIESMDISSVDGERITINLSLREVFDL